MNIEKIRAERKQKLRDVLEKGEPVELRATFECQTKVIKESDSDSAPVIEMIASTNAVDRDNDTIDQSGWNLTSYLENPVVPWAHDYSIPPVARAPNTRVDDGPLVQTWEFTPRDLSPFGFMIGRMYEKKFLNTSSVGFSPTRWEYNEQRDGFDFKEQDLLESSAVVVPSNPGALVSAREAGIDTGPMVRWAEKQLDAGEGLQRDFIETIWKQSGGSKTSVHVQKDGRVLNTKNKTRCRGILCSAAEILQDAGEDPLKVLEEEMDPDHADEDEKGKMKTRQQITRIIARAIAQKDLTVDGLTDIADRLGDIRQEAASVQGAIGAILSATDEPDPEIVEVLDNIASRLGDIESQASDLTGMIGGVVAATGDEEDEPEDVEEDAEDSNEEDEESKSVAKCNTPVAKCGRCGYAESASTDNSEDNVIRIAQ